MDAAGEIRHELVHFCGHVQGVGFRYAALQLAAEYEVAGYAQNLSDGRVRVELAGEAQEIERYVKALEERMQGYIRNVERSGESRVPKFHGFTIR